MQVSHGASGTPQKSSALRAAAASFAGAVMDWYDFLLVLTLLLMGLGTAAIGLLPTYGQVGVLAPILLVALRFIQGFAVGGEWGGAALMAVESAPEAKRGFFGSFVRVGASIGLLIATGLVAIVNALTTNEQFLAWGWRIPFIASIAVVAMAAVTPTSHSSWRARA